MVGTTSLKVKLSYDAGSGSSRVTKLFRMPPTPGSSNARPMHSCTSLQARPRYNCLRGPRSTEYDKWNAPMMQGHHARNDNNLHLPASCRVRALSAHRMHACSCSDLHAAQTLGVFSSWTGTVGIMCQTKRFCSGHSSIWQSAL
jgi:hypothetical protein